MDLGIKLSLEVAELIRKMCNVGIISDGRGFKVVYNVCSSITFKNEFVFESLNSFEEIRGVGVGR